MSEEIKKKAQDAQLNPEDLDKVAGGIAGSWYGWDGKCPFCGGANVEWIPYAHIEVCNDCDREITTADI